MSTTPSPSYGPCAPSQRRLDALASRGGEKCGLVTGRRQRGFSFPELMVAIVIGSLLLVVAIRILASGKQTYRAQGAQARMQEAGRFGVEFLGFDIRMAGFMGCPNLRRLTPRMVANPAPGIPFDLGNFIRGYEATSGTWSPALPVSLAAATAGRDAFTVQHAGNCGVELSLDMAADTDVVSVSATNACGFAPNDLLIISDCVTADIFRATAVTTSGGTDLRIYHALAANTSDRLTKAYGDHAQLFKLQTISYYIAPGASGEPALWQLVESGVPLELVEGVEDMQILYGDDNNDDLAADRYLPANGATLNMSNVVGLRLSLLVRSIATNVAEIPQTYAYNGMVITAPDKRMRRVFTTTVNLRDRTL